ncbi:MAG: hypothetical protein AVDCRST_MAG66-2290, partial [uncultured Pseudonocardia sp.]
GARTPRAEHAPGRPDRHPRHTERPGRAGLVARPPPPVDRAADAGGPALLGRHRGGGVADAGPAPVPPGAARTEPARPRGAVRFADRHGDPGRAGLRGADGPVVVGAPPRHAQPGEVRPALLVGRPAVGAGPAAGAHRVLLPPRRPQRRSRRAPGRPLGRHRDPADLRRAGAAVAGGVGVGGRSRDVVAHVPAGPADRVVRHALPVPLPRLPDRAADRGRAADRRPLPAVGVAGTARGGGGRGGPRQSRPVGL